MHDATSDASGPAAPASTGRPAAQVLLGELARGSGLELRIRGGCMEPVLRDGERVTVRRRRLYLPGDVLAVCTAGGLVVHRLLGYRPRRHGWEVWTRADRAPRSDRAVPLGAVLGRVERCRRGRFGVSLRERSGALVHLLTAAAAGLGGRVVRAAAGARP